MPRPQFPVILTDKKRLSHNTLELAFEFEGGAPFDYIAGQFVQLLFQYQGKEHKRSYSVACSPESFQDSRCLTIAIGFVENGAASCFFRDAEPGIRLMLTGPFGVLVLPEELPGQLILAGTGTGIAPYRAMIPKLTQLAGQGQSISILVGARTHNELIYHEDFRLLAEKCSTINYRICLSRVAPSSLQDSEFTGYVQQQFSSLSLQTDKDIVFLCGNPGMIDAAAAQLKEKGFSTKQVRREKYVYSGH
ncbi:FAD-binding oxidoreductase [Endozoicomonas sp. Mp262]|uniref:ferredoxin--NADP reductase n=1 Tax=Endozoicomonas sp. Mp262 TaxID=2919499 RepID=UPI0021D99505